MLNRKFVNTMLQYIIILLDETSTSYCHYENSKKEKKLIDLEDLKMGILFGMKENLMIQFVYPEYELPQEYIDVIESIDHNKIIPSTVEDVSLKNEADVIVFHDWEDLHSLDSQLCKCCVLRTKKNELFEKYELLKKVTSNVYRFNLVITDIDTFSEEDFEKYKQTLKSISGYIEQLYVSGKIVQTSCVTDRMMLSQMNNCNAGISNITLAPNGKFYICPAFYFENEDEDVGDIKHGLDIKNKRLYQFDHAPICRLCDAYQCKRCVWMNRKTTLEVNTPSHEQCVVAHLERNAARDLQQRLEEAGFGFEEEIKEISYLDPFDVRDKLSPESIEL